MPPFLPRLEDVPWLTLLILIYALLDMLGWSEGGVLSMQMQLLHETRSTRSFAEDSTQGFSPLRPLLLLQLFLCSGLTLYCAGVPSAGARLMAPTGADLLSLAVCLALPAGWFALQQGSLRWACYLSRAQSQGHIMSRISHAIHLLAAPASLVILTLTVAGVTGPVASLVLLAALFISIQIALIYIGFKIFLTDFGSLCLIIAYLCALEIAPLYIFWQKMT